MALSLDGPIKCVLSHDLWGKLSQIAIKQNPLF